MPITKALTSQYRKTIPNGTITINTFPSRLLSAPSSEFTRVMKNLVSAHVSSVNQNLIRQPNDFALSNRRNDERLTSITVNRVQVYIHPMLVVKRRSVC
jgi:hypothetical protein